MIVTFDDGAQTHVAQWGTSGPAILCVHGMTSSRFSWTRFGNAFADRYRVFAYDQRGHGDSANVPGPMSLDRAGADLHAVIAALGEVDVLAGHSWGGAVVLRGGRTTAAKRVIAVDPMIYVPAECDWHEEYVADFERDCSLSSQERERAYRERYAKAGWGPEDIEAKLHAVASMTVEPLLRLDTENHAAHGGWDLRDAVMEYPKPLLLALAMAPESTVSAEERAWLTHYGGPNVTTITYNGEGHNLHRTAFERFAADTARWLAATDGP